ncbi:MAG TPA: hypothetical protein VHQ23_03475, partial [Ilumatobacteraceae bacterium]|nr:hypothetical protein [Ilumatobacteraceae bacterium]
HGLTTFDDGLQPSEADDEDPDLDLDLPEIPTDAGYVFADGKSVAEVKAELREQNADIAKHLVDRTGWSHGRVNGELNRLAGLASVGGATNAQLRSRLKQGEKWLKT